MARAAARAESPGELVAETEAILAEEVERFGTALARERRADGRSPDGERAGERPADGSLADGLLGDGLLANGGPTAGEHTRGRSGGRGRRAGRETDRWGVPTDGGPTARSLRDRGARLLAESAETDRGDRGEPVHPAYARIVEEIAADEARILRLLATEGPQPSVDVRDGGLVPLTTDLIAAGLSMIGNRAGCRREERTSAYLNNLQRLGLVWFSEEPVAELKRYQVVEAQPDVLEARERARRPKIDRRSVHLTPFGVDFCRVCLPVEVIADGAMGAYELPDDGESPGDGDGPSRDG
ncbi:hypothetical protein BRC90_12205 [Halobacteriales archaeon QS_4_69_34]|nr:MAG: hypothetical protein BRC90_12205 [Halobacteriales archaeon QS_4_69_34]